MIRCQNTSGWPGGCRSRFTAVPTQAIVASRSHRPRALGKGLYFVPGMLRALARMPVFRLGRFLGGSSAMSLRALLYRRPTEPQSIDVVFDKSIYLVRVRRHRQARRYTLAHRCSLARGRADDSAARQPARKHASSRRSTAPGSRRACSACRRRRRSRRAWWCRSAACRIASSIGAHVRGTVWTETERCRRAPDLRRRRAAASQPAGRRFPQARSAARSRCREPALCQGARRRDQAHLGARPVEPLGLVLELRRAVVLVAADPRAALRARTISPRTRSPIWSSSTIRRGSGGC